MCHFLKGFLFACLFLHVFHAYGAQYEVETDYVYEQSLCDSVLLFVPSIHIRAGNGRSYRNGYESVETFLTYFDPICGNSVYVDLDFLRVEKGRLSTNSAFGFRSFSSDFEKMIGAYLSFDTRHLSGENITQIGLGAELLSLCWEMRINGYIPFGNKRVFLDTKVINYDGGFFAIRDRFEWAMWGIDVEVGKTFPSHLCCVDFYLGLGPYFYGSNNCCGSLVGGMGRLIANFYDKMFLEFYITYDHLFHVKAQFEFSLFIPLSTSCELWRCIFRPIFRNRVILTEKACCWETNF